MPLYKWYGTGHDRTIVHGNQFARHVNHLIQLLHEQGIMLIASTPLRRSLSITTIMKERIALFAQLGTLINAGVRVVDALETLAASTHHQYIRLILYDCVAALREGIPLSEAAGYHEEFFSPLACCMFTSSEQTGTLGACCQNLARDYRTIDDFVRHIRTILFMPCITLICSLIIFFLILYTIVPRLTALLITTKAILPRKTTILIALSTFLHTPLGIALVCTLLLSSLAAGILIRRSLRTQIPFMLARWAIVHDLSAAIFFRTLGLLMQAGVPLLTALQVAPWSPLCKQYAAITNLVIEGIPLSTAVQDSIGPLEPFCITLLKVGEATGSLATMATTCGEFYQERVMAWCTTISKLVQPSILIALGLFIAYIMIALYEPLLTIGTTLS